MPELTPEAAAANFADLSADGRSGQGIVIGLSADADMVLQVAWSVGDDGGRRDPFAGVTGEPVDGRYLVTNGSHAGGIAMAMRTGRSFYSAFADAVGDGPFGSPRLAGAMVLPDGSDRKASGGYELIFARDGSPVRSYHADTFNVASQGLGRCMNTYMEEGDLEAFCDKPYEVLPLGRDIEETTDMYWASLAAGADSFVAVRGVYLDSGAVNHRVTRWLLGPSDVSAGDEAGAR